MGVTRACFDPDGTVPVDKETLTIVVTRGARLCRHCLVRIVGWDQGCNCSLVTEK